MRLSNFLPEAKKDYYRNNPLDSVKQHLMMQCVRWYAESIVKHGEAMKNVLLKSLESGRGLISCAVVWPAVAGMEIIHPHSPELMAAKDSQTQTEP